MLTEEEFRTLVDSAPDKVSALSEDLEQLYEHYGIEIGQYVERRVIVDHLRAKIASAFRSGAKEVQRHCQLIQRQVIFRHILDSAPLFPYLDIAYEIEEIVRLPLATRVERDDWTQAICAASDLLKVSVINRDLDDFRRVLASDFAVAEAVKHLREQGFQVDMGDDTPLMESTGGIALVSKIHDDVRRLGGIRLAALVFSVLKPLFDPMQQRYHLRPPANLIGEVASPQVPANYLLQLAAKYTSRGLR